MKKILSLVLALVMTTLLLSACQGQNTPPQSSSTASSTPESTQSSTPAADAVTLKAAHSVDPQHPYHLGLERYKELVEERTGGKVVIDIFHSAQLGNERDCVEGLQMGTLDIAVSSTGPLTGFASEFSILDLPYLFTDNEHVDRVLDGEIGQQLISKLEPIGIIGGAFWENGFRQITNSEKPIETVADLKGLKLRTQENEIHLEAFTTLGASPMPMAWSEVFTALQQKVINGQENPIPVIYTSKLFEVQNYLAISRHLYSPAMLLVSKKTMDKLDAETQKILVDTAKEVAPYQRQLIREQEAKQIDLLEEAGMTITYPDQVAFREACQPVYSKFEEKLGKELIDSILNG